MAGPGLNTSPVAGSTTGHTTAHGTAHAYVNMLDSTIVSGGSTGQATVKLSGGTYGPAPLGIAGMAPGSRLTLIWDAVQTRWEDTTGAAVTARPGSRNDVLLDLIGGATTDAPAWANQSGDIHYPTL